MGVHSSLQTEITDLLDVIVADIDGGSINIPESLVPPVSTLPPAIWESTQNALTMVLQPHLSTADMAFAQPPSTQINSKSQLMQDKEIRAVFMRMFAQLLQGYRSCLTLIRIHPKPVITFHKAGFLGARDLVNCDFLLRVLDSMFFTGFVTERGPPWRPCDAWDELYSAMTDLTRTENQNPKLVRPSNPILCVCVSDSNRISHFPDFSSHTRVSPDIIHERKSQFTSVHTESVATTGRRLFTHPSTANESNQRRASPGNHQRRTVEE